MSEGIQGPACKDGKKNLSASSSCSSVKSTAPSHFGWFHPLAWSLGFSSCSAMHRGACKIHADHCLLGTPTFL